MRETPPADPSERDPATFDPDRYDAVLFDLDGVLTPTVEIHKRAWRELFTGYFSEHGITPQYTDEDYFAHVDGRPRYEGVRECLASRDVRIPEGDPSDEPGTPTVCGLGNLKDAEVNRILATDGVQPYPGSVAWLDALVAGGTRVAVVSSSRNTRTVLAAADLADRFTVVVDGVRAAADGLPGKPRPDTYVQAARDLGVPVQRAVVVEDAVSGVAAGRAGDFGLVIGVDRGVGHDALRDAGADLVVADLAELLP
ncbi:HAD-IA family hydrolase [Isoptericola sp. b441]|uniref:HAD-IA family hydrolase n=1 Tax=Actinotalea lenta TaxID=3064654 RepID=A0ABT9D598_9CELL|nr:MULTISPECIES: HAD-IA family hydrolase [unclassified Isoptericola]MDO8105937.1 HAD-IA family hydrolase [Isoptericola sp. b441]MDO8122652.1 HAD-IA family hydrolase [Isoptericola sp. b490]